MSSSFTGILRKIANLTPVTDLAFSTVEVIAGVLKEDPKDVEKALAHDPQKDEFYGVDFGEAILALKDGRLVRRMGWNGKGMFLSLWSPYQESDMTLPYIYMRTAQGEDVPWVASQTDMLGEDWEIVE